MDDDRQPSGVLWALVAVAAIASVIVVAMIILSYINPFGYEMMRNMMGGTSFGLFPILVIIVVIVIIVMLVIILGKPSITPDPQYQYSTPPAMTPSQILEQRYARGDITREEYQQMRSDLEDRGQDSQRV